MQYESGRGHQTTRIQTFATHSRVRSTNHQTPGGTQCPGGLVVLPLVHPCQHLPQERCTRLLSVQADLCCPHHRLIQQHVERWCQLCLHPLVHDLQSHKERLVEEPSQVWSSRQVRRV